VGDYLDLAYKMGQLAHAAERLEAVVRDAAPLLTLGDLKRLMGSASAKGPGRSMTSTSLNGCFGLGDLRHYLCFVLRKLVIRRFLNSQQ
jgi:hypothetical protein